MNLLRVVVSIEERDVVMVNSLVPKAAIEELVVFLFQVEEVLTGYPEAIRICVLYLFRGR